MSSGEDDSSPPKRRRLLPGEGVPSSGSLEGTAAPEQPQGAAEPGAVASEPLQGARAVAQQAAAALCIFTALQQRAQLGIRCPAGRLRGLEVWCCPRLRVDRALDRHLGCVNTVAWSAGGSFLASGSDDKTICLWSYNQESHLACQLRTGHEANIFSVKFLSDTSLCSCAADGTSRLMDLEEQHVVRVWDVNQGPVHKLVPVLDDNIPASSFLSGGEDGVVRQHDVRSPDAVGLVTSQAASDAFGVPFGAIFSMATCALRPHWLVLGGESPFVWLFDRRWLQEPCGLFRPSDAPWGTSTVTGVALAPDGGRLLASWSSHHIFEFAVCNGLSSAQLATQGCDWCHFLGEFGGHSNRRTIKEVAYLGTRGELVASGSEDGRLFIWSSRTKALVCLGEDGDSRAINTLAQHPARDLCLATGGIDSTVKLWVPSAAKPCTLAGAQVDDICRRNEFDARSSFPFDLDDDMFEEY